MRLIDADAFEIKLASIAKAKAKSEAQKALMGRCFYCLEKAPTIKAFTLADIEEQYRKGLEKGLKERPQGEREFIEILAQNVPEDLCTYPEYKGKPYYSIHYKENGEEFVGFGTYNPEVLSRYLREYFMNCGASMSKKEGETNEVDN